MSSPIFEEEMSYKGKKLLQDTHGSALRVFMCHRYLFLSNFMTFQENAMVKQDSNSFSQKAGKHHLRNPIIQADGSKKSLAIKVKLLIRCEDVGY